MLMLYIRRISTEEGRAVNNNKIMAKYNNLPNSSSYPSKRLLRERERSDMPLYEEEY